MLARGIARSLPAADTSTVRPRTLGLPLVAVCLTLAAAISAGAAPAQQRAAPTTQIRVRAALAHQQLAIQALASRRASLAYRYAAALAQVNIALADLGGVEADLVAAARENGPPSNSTRIDRLLNSAYGGDNHASVQLSEALWLITKHAPASNTYSRQARIELQAATVATRSLAELLG